MEYTRIPKQLKLGAYYAIYFNYNRIMMCQFIQPTKCGFNFLNLNTNKCILKHHLYPSKCDYHKSGDWFWVNNRMIITECKK